MKSEISSGRAGRSAILLILIGAGLLLGLQGENGLAFERTEVRDDCSQFNENRVPYFGDLHIHTSFSQDAFVFDLRNDPEDAYAFAKGAPLDLPESADNPVQSRTVQLARSLDFAAVTDHSEFLGPLRICQTPSATGYDSQNCMQIRGELAPAPPARVLGLVFAVVDWIGQSALSPSPALMSFCGDPGVDCASAGAAAWSETQAAAEDHYDRTSSCAFTTFVGYEYSSMPGGNNLHRNVLFRNANVQTAPTTAIDTSHDVTVLWSELKAECLDSGTGCDVLTIPHNSNLSNGLMFEDPVDADEAATRAFFEPLVEVFQHKGSSECRYDPRYGAGVETDDTLCTFEQYSHLNLAGALAPLAPPPDQFPPRAFVRNALKDGLVLERSLGVNPFKFGLLSSTDGHGGTTGFTDETQYEGHLGALEATIYQQIVNRIGIPNGTNNPGGLAVVWAEENSRDSLFEAMRRRETYGTSGTRPVLRLFAGDVARDLCADGDIAGRGYVDGVPMGGEIGAVRRRKSPRFAVSALKDPGLPGFPGTDLQRVQIIKGWVDAAGVTHERVFDVAGDANNGATIDPASCDRVGAGASELCAVWEDPDFDADESAFYYVRVLENPTCRWSTLQCLAAGVDVFTDRVSCEAQALAAGLGGATLGEVCCMNTGTDPFVERVIQERAWSSPVWYRPQAVGKVRGRLRFGREPGQDRLHVKARIHALPPSVNPALQDLSLEVRGAQAIFSASIPAGTMVESGGGRKFVFRDPGGGDGGLRDLTVVIASNGAARLRFQTGRMDLSSAGNEDAFVEIRLTVGEYTTRHQRRWVFDGSRLRTG